jgi:hypothetical protein
MQTLKKVTWGPSLSKKVEKECIDITQARGLASCLHQHNRVPMQKYMTLRIVQYKILIGAMEAQISISYQTIKQQSKHLTIAKSTVG